MRSRLAVLLALLFAAAGACVAASSAAPAQTSPPPMATLADKPLSERVVAYQIDARFDANKRALDATEVLTYRNLTGQPQDTFPFHLYSGGASPQVLNSPLSSPVR